MSKERFIGLLAQMVLRQICLLILVIFCIPVQAGVWNLYGLGSQNAPFGAGAAAVSGDAFSQTYNPALMSDQKKGLFSFHILGAYTSFENINRVLVDTPALSGENQATYADVSTRTQDLFVVALAIETPLSRVKPRSLHLGLHVTTPFDRLMGADTQDGFLPQYAFYGGEPQKLTLGMNISYQFFECWKFGVGVNSYLVTSATARIRLPPGGNANARMKMDVRSGLAPVAGVVFSPSEFWNFGLSYRAKQDYKMEMDINNTINIIGSPAPLYFTMSSSLFYEPETYSLAASFKDDFNKFAIGARYEKWSGYSGSTLNLNFQNFKPSLGQHLPGSNFHDVIHLSVGAEHKFDWLTTRLGYFYMPSPVPDQSGETNYLDSDKNMVTGGLGKGFEFSWLDNPLNFDLALFSQFLKRKEIKKTSPDHIGYPGYTIGGAAYGFSFTATTEF